MSAIVSMAHPCPSCGCAAEDGKRLRKAPFTGTACFWCGACWGKDAVGAGYTQLPRRVLACDPPIKGTRGWSEFLLSRPEWGHVERVW